MDLKKIIHTTITEFLNEQDSLQTEKRFVVDEKNHNFQLFLGDILVSESKFNIEKPDKWFKQKYVTIFDLKTVEKFQGKGLAKHLLEHIFDYVKNKLNINIISLLVKNSYSDSNSIYIFLDSDFT